MKIMIEDIPHAIQRYETCGDWQLFPGDLTKITVSREMGRDSCFLVALHELIEVELCRRRGISQEAVDAFDFEYEKNRKPGDESEPGDDPSAPYYKEHQAAMIFERTLAGLMEVDWKKHEENVNGL
jgi:hypothetical protein